MIPKISFLVFGPTSAGKSTLVDCLLEGYYSQTSTRTCTNGIFRFNVQHDQNDGNGGANAKLKKASFQSVNEIHDEIKKINEQKEEKDKFNDFKVELREPLCKMKSGIQLEIIDVPGFLEVADCNVFNREWSTLGCIIAIFDLRSPTLTANLNVLNELAEWNQDKNIDVVVVGNKVDYPEDEGVTESIRQINEATGSIFKENKPEFVSLSAKAAVSARSLFKLDHDTFTSHYQHKINEIGASYFGAMWNSFPEKERPTKIHDAMNNDYHKIMEQSNLARLLTILNGKMDETRQVEIVLRNADYKLSKLQCNSPGWEDEFINISHGLSLANISPFQYKERIVSLFLDKLKEVKAKAQNDFTKSKSRVASLVSTLQLLDKCGPVLFDAPVKDAKERLAQERKSIALIFFRVAFSEQFILFRDDDTGIHNGFSQRVNGSPPRKMRRYEGWSTLTLMDWKGLFRATLEVPRLEEIFPQEYRFLKETLENYPMSFSGDECRYISQNDHILLRLCYDDDSEKPQIKALGDDTLPKSYEQYLNGGTPKDPSHFAHILWLYID